MTSTLSLSLSLSLSPPLGKREYLKQPIQMQLSPKSKIFSEHFSEFLKSTSNFDKFETKDEPHSLCTSEIIACKKRRYLNG